MNFIVIGVSLAIAVVVIVIRMIIKTRRGRVVVWSEAASGLGLEFTPPKKLFGKFEMTGTVAGFDVRVHTYTQSTGESSSTFTKYAVQFPSSLALGLKLHKEGKILGKIAKFFGAQDHSMGDSSFDNNFMIKGEDSEQVSEFLTPERKQELLELQQKLPAIRITDNDISWTTGGVAKDAEKIVEVVSDITRVAWHLAGHLVNADESGQ